MAALNPPQFTFPPIRYSPIQEAFRGALDVGMSQLFQLPFQKLAMKRSLAQFEREQDIQRESELRFTGPMAQAKQQADINTGQVVDEETLDPDTRANLARAGAAPKYSIGGKNYYAPDSLIAAKKYSLPVPANVQTYIDDARKRMGLRGEVGKPVTEGELPEVATSMGIEKEAADYRRQIEQFEELRVDQAIQSLSTPGPEFMDFAQRVAFEQDPQHPGHLSRDYHDIFVYSKMPQYMAALNNPVFQRPENAVFRKQIEENLARAVQLAPLLRYTTSFFPTKEDMDRRLATIRNASPAAAMTGEGAILARLAAKWNLLKDPDSGRFIVPRGNTLDMSRAIEALQHNPDLLEAMVYATAYGTWDNLQSASRIGAPYPTNQKVRDYLQYQIFPAMGTGSPVVGAGGIHDPLSPNYNPAAGTLVPGLGGEGPAANQVQPSTPTTGSKPLMVPAGPAQVLGGKAAAGAAPVGQIGMSEGGRALYNGIYSKAKSDPQSFVAMRTTLDSLFSGPPDRVLDALKAMARDASLPLSQDDRNQLVLAVHTIMSAPPNKRATMISTLKYMMISHAVMAREDALGESLTVKPEATATGAKPEKKPAEKKPE